MLIPSGTASIPSAGQFAAVSAKAANCRWQNAQVAAPMNSTTGWPRLCAGETIQV